ncbi:NADP-dependent malic enzyme [Kitasatospora sp. NPDC058965]|uniref:NAD(P)-dependent malic enzyme n=1 Tax=Kitasatospora sp. NPDC058965 TaxID=3346682 RepID=UPI0036A8E2E9
MTIAESAETLTETQFTELTEALTPEQEGDSEPIRPFAEPVFELHLGGKLETRSTVPLRDAADLSLAYTPGVARVCTAIAERPELAHRYTWAANTVAVVTDGTAVLGLGDIGPAASLPVMEGKAVLFKEFGGVDAVPIALATTDVDELVTTVRHLAPSFGGINLEDIAAPRCFEIEDRLRAELDIPVFHDDQHGTAIVALAALRNAARLTGRPLSELRAVVAGAGASGIAVSTILLEAGIGDLVAADSKGLLHRDRTDLHPVKAALAARSNKAGLSGTLADALKGADVFVGLSGAQVGEEAIASMAPGAIVFALSNPTPEIDPAIARKYAAVVATGRSDFPNQINNVLAFPGVFRGALDVRARTVTEGMKLAAATAIADLVGDQELTADFIVPSPFDPRVAPAVAAAVAAEARAAHVARV